MHLAVSIKEKGNSKQKNVNTKKEKNWIEGKVELSTQEDKGKEGDDDGQEVVANDATRDETSNERKKPYLNPFGLFKDTVG